MPIFEFPTLAEVAPRHILRTLPECAGTIVLEPSYSAIRPLDPVRTCETSRVPNCRTPAFKPREPNSQCLAEREFRF